MKALGGQRHAPAALSPGTEPVPLVREAGWDPGQDKSIKSIDIIYHISYYALYYSLQI
jgi:hypothetical protein